VSTKERSVIDTSNANDGYIMVRYTGTRPAIIIQVTPPKGNPYTYEINSPGTGFHVIPLTEGNGKYTIGFLERTTGSNAARLDTVEISVTLRDQFAPFLMPNHFVNYTANSAVVTQGAQLSRGRATEVEKVSAVYNWFVDNIKYDDALAANPPAGYTPNLATLMTSKKGICFDYASGMTAMLRSQGIPTKLEVGWANTRPNPTYHAWISVYTRHNGWVNGWIRFNGNSWVLMEPTWAASNGDSNTNFQTFVKNLGNYTTWYSY
jgi:transglutaminase-like putative cysteine protease